MITGVLEASGGPAPGSPRPLPGTVTIRARNGQTTKTAVGPNGDFSASVPVGQYTVTGRSPFYQNGQWDCLLSPPATITATTGSTAQVTLSCEDRSYGTSRRLADHRISSRPSSDDRS